MIDEQRTIMGISFSRRAGGALVRMSAGQHITLNPYRRGDGSSAAWVLRINNQSPTFPPQLFSSPEDAVQQHYDLLQQ